MSRWTGVADTRRPGGRATACSDPKEETLRDNALLNIGCDGLSNDETWLMSTCSSCVTHSDHGVLTTPSSPRHEYYHGRNFQVISHASLETSKSRAEVGTTLRRCDTVIGNHGICRYAETPAPSPLRRTATAGVGKRSGSLHLLHIAS